MSTKRIEATASAVAWRVDMDGERNDETGRYPEYFRLGEIEVGPDGIKPPFTMKGTPVRVIIEWDSDDE